MNLREYCTGSSEDEEQTSGKDKNVSFPSEIVKRAPTAGPKWLAITFKREDLLHVDANLRHDFRYCTCHTPETSQLQPLKRESFIDDEGTLARLAALSCPALRPATARNGAHVSLLLGRFQSFSRTLPRRDVHVVLRPQLGYKAHNPGKNEGRKQAPGQ